LSVENLIIDIDTQTEHRAELNVFRKEKRQNTQHKQISTLTEKIIT